MLPNPTSPDAVTHTVAVVPMNFRKDHEPIPGQPGEFREVHRVDLVKKGSNGQSTPWKISALQKNEILWPHVRPAYEAWLHGQEEPATGTPLDVWPAVTKGQADHLKSLHIRSVEDLAAVTDADLDRIGMGARTLREKAKAYVEAKAGQAVIAEQLAERDATIAQQRQELDELKALVNEMTKGKPKREKPGDAAKGEA